MNNTFLMIAGQIMFALWVFSGFNFRTMGRIIAAGVIGLTLIVIGIFTFNGEAFKRLTLIPEFVTGKKEETKEE